MNAVDLYFFFYESWFVFDLFFVFVIDAMPKKKKDIAGHGVAFLDCLTWLDGAHGARGAR